VNRIFLFYMKVSGYLWKTTIACLWAISLVNFCTSFSNIQVGDFSLMKSPLLQVTVYRIQKRHFLTASS